MYVDINYDEYQTYLPLNSVEDVYFMIKSIKGNERLKDCKVYLLGWSEGTIIAPLVAEKYPDMVDGLLLAGYVNQNMKDVLTWQNSGGSSMVWYRGNFKADKQGRISKQAYEANPNNVIVKTLQNATFESIDINKDGYLTEEDFTAIYADVVGYSLNDVLSAIERRDDEWLKKNYGGGLIQLTSAWFLQHFSLRSNMELLPKLDLPIYIFHGTIDQNVDVREVYKICDEFKKLGKTNLTINVFENHNHDLNYIDIITKKEIPIGIKSILDTMDKI
jgi:pimeloyl-ACP methyl ester carboxylesterase